MKFLIAFVAIAASAPASAQMVESKVTASNGIVIEINKDDFAGRAEYGASFEKLVGSSSQTGQFVVAKIINPNSKPRVSVQGFVGYRGEWHHYDNAIFKGGEAVEFINTKKDVVSCRYGCSYSESFIAFPTTEQITKYAENGVLPIQIRGRSSGNTLLLNVPISHIAAINEVAK